MLGSYVPDGVAAGDFVLRTARGCTVRYVASGPTVAHIEGHIAFAATR